MRGRGFYGGGVGFLLCFAAERKRCATGSLFQLPPPSHTLLREKGLCDRIFALFGTLHCVAFRQKRNAVRPKVRGSSPYSLMRFFGKSDPQRSVHT